jgi:hypothetical protein
MKVQDAIRGLKKGKARGCNGLPSTALKHLPQWTVSLVALLNAALLAQYFPAVWKHACVISILKPGKDLSLPSSYRPISLLDNWKNVRKILLSMILSEVSGRGLLRDEQFGFGPKHSTTLQLARIVETVTRNFGEKRPTGAIFLDVAEVFDTVCVDCFIFKLTALNFPLYLVRIPPISIIGRSRRISRQPHTPAIVCVL